MVTGVELFRDHFAGHEHQYVLIGGAACDLLMDEAGLDFRATKDLDIVLIVEALDAAFAERFWDFINQGKYQIAERSEGERVFYRFQKPENGDFPAMLELFSRTPEGIVLAEDNGFTPLPISEEAASLSAILLDEDYYGFLKSMVRMVNGIPLLGEAAIIPFKARAWLDLTERRAAGDRVDAKNIAKHRKDVARMLQLLPRDARYNVPDRVREDLAKFVAELDKAADFEPKAFGVDMTRETVIERFNAAYGL